MQQVKSRLHYLQRLENIPNSIYDFGKEIVLLEWILDKQVLDMNIERVMKQVSINGYYTCDCGNNVEPDGECYCGRKNPLVENGLIQSGLNA